MIWIILIVIVILLILYYLNFKRLKVSSLNLITGSLGTGKSAFSLKLALFHYKRNLFYYYLNYFFAVCMSCFGLDLQVERPQLYSNIPLGVKYTPLNSNILQRKERIAYKSIVFIDEMSLIVDNYDIKDNQLNNDLKMFFKLFRHMSKGGKMFINTQSIKDNHFIVKRCINQYLYIHSKIRLPFISILKVREMIYDEDGSSINTFNEDIEEGLKIVIIPNKVFKLYDTYCYSILTDNLDYCKKTFKRLYKKIKNILTFKK